MTTPEQLPDAGTPQRIQLIVEAPSEGLTGKSNGLSVAISLLTQINGEISAAEQRWRSFVAATRSSPFDETKLLSRAAPSAQGGVKPSSAASTPTKAGADVGAASAGRIPLQISPGQIVASVTGPIRLVIPSSQVQAAGVGPGVHAAVTAPPVVPGARGAATVPLPGVRGGGAGHGGGGVVPPPPVAPGAGGAAPGESGRGIVGRNIVESTKHFLQWSAAAAGVYQSMRLLKSGIVAVVENETAIARLSQVFRGTGGSARQLADDVMRLASSEGQSTSAALESAIAWSRLGLTRIEVAEAVRTALRAANIAEIDSIEATEKLSSIMAGFGLRVGQLAGVLNELNAISNTYNVTVDQMLTGISKTGSIARAAGVSLSELSGIVGAAVGSSGQSGDAIGTSIKTIIARTNNPKVQEALRNKFQVEVSTAGGEDLKSFSDILSEIFVRYQALNSAERQSLLVRTAGTHQAARLGSVLDSYVKAQTLSIQSQLAINSAENEDVRIRSALAAQLKSLTAEFQRFASIQGRGPSDALGAVAVALKNVLSLLNSNVGSALTSGLLGILAAVGAKLAVTSVQMQRAGAASGFLGSSFDAVAQAAASLNRIAGVAVTRFVSSGQNLTKFGASARIVASNLLVLSQASGIAAARAGGLALGFRSVSIAARVAAVSVAVLWEAFLPMALIAGGIFLFNRAFAAVEASSEKGARKLAGFSDEAEKASKAAAAAAETTKLISTVQSAIPNARPADQKKMLSGIGEVAFLNADNSPDTARNDALKSELRTMLEQKDVAGIQARLEEVKRETVLRGAIARDQELKALAEQTDEIKQQIVDAEKLGKTKQAAELKTKLADLSEKKVAKHSEQLSTMTEDRRDFLESDARHLAFLEKQKVVLSAISAIYSELPQFGHSDRLAAEAEAIKAQVAFTEATLRALETDSSVADEARKEREATKQRIGDELTQTRSMLADVERAAATIPEPAQKFFNQHENRNVLRKLTNEQLNQHLAGAMLTAIPNAVGNVETPIGNEFTGVPFSVREGAVQLEQLSRERDGLRTKLDELLQQRGANEKVATSPEIRNQSEIEATEKDLRELRARMAALSSTNARRLAEQRDRNELAVEFAKATSAASAVGPDAGKRFENQVSFLEKASKSEEAQGEVGQALTGRSVATDNLLIAALEHRVELNAKLEQGGLRLLEIKRDELNLADRLNRENERSLLTAGPGEMLRKLAIAQIGRRGPVSAGQFFALNPDARRDLLNEPEFNPELRDLRREETSTRNTLNRRGLRTVEDFQHLRQRGSEDRARLMNLIRPNARPEIGINESARVAAGEITALGTAAGRTARELALVNAGLSTMKARLDSIGNAGSAQANYSAPDLAQANFETRS